MFINYSVNKGITINAYRNNGVMNDDVTYLAYDILAGRDGSCSLEGAKDALEDGTMWQGSAVTTEILEDIHSAICEWEAERV